MTATHLIMALSRGPSVEFVMYRNITAAGSPNLTLACVYVRGTVKERNLSFIHPLRRQDSGRIALCDRFPADATWIEAR